MTKQAEQKMNADMRSYRRILRVPWTDKRTNVSIIEQLGIKEETLKHKMTYLGKSKRHNRLEMILYEDITEGKAGRTSKKEVVSRYHRSPIQDRYPGQTPGTGLPSAEISLCAREHICHIDEHLTFF